MNNQTFSQTSAFLYVRVSTEEQSLKGNSLKIQEEILRQYCHLQGITIERVFVENHSAKTFNRPAWNKMMSEISASSKQPGLILFTRWDRFSRNTADAYYTIRKLDEMRIKACAIEQPLDLTVPENKMMLAFYLAIPEVENDRRGLNVKKGMQKAKESGKWMGQAPIGFINYTYPDGTKTIVRKDPEASIIADAFNKLANGTYTVTGAYHASLSYGLKCSRANFWNLIKNPAYCGNIKVVGDDKKEMLIPGLHLGFVSPDTFDAVQRLFKPKGRKYCVGYSSQFPFRGFLQCPRCQKILTASTSTGRSYRHSYYHCNSKCGYRVKMEIINERFNNEISKFHLCDKYKKSYEDIFDALIKKRYTELSTRKTKVLKNIDRFVERIAKAKDLMFSNQIELEDYCEIKADYERKISLLGEVINSCSQIQLQLESAKIAISKNGLQLNKIFDRLTDENRRSFLHHILVRPTKWEPIAVGECVFNAAFNNLSAQNIHDNGMSRECVIQSEKLLYHLANLEFSVETTSNKFNDWFESI